MRRIGLIFLGLLLLTGGVGVLGWRIHNDPGILERYERALTGAPQQTGPEAPGDQSRKNGTGGYVDSSPLESERQT